MIVKIRAQNGPNLTIPIPVGLFCNRLTAGFAARMMARNGMDMNPAQMAKLFRTIRSCKRRNPGWVMVELQSAGGDWVSVKP